MMKSVTQVVCASNLNAKKGRIHICMWTRPSFDFLFLFYDLWICEYFKPLQLTQVGTCCP